MTQDRSLQCHHKITINWSIMKWTMAILPWSLKYTSLSVIFLFWTGWCWEETVTNDPGQKVSWFVFFYLLKNVFLWLLRMALITMTPQNWFDSFILKRPYVACYFKRSLFCWLYYNRSTWINVLFHMHDISALLFLFWNVLIEFRFVQSFSMLKSLECPDWTAKPMHCDWHVKRAWHLLAQSASKAVANTNRY